METIAQILIVLVPAVFAVTLHEVAHGWTANRLGDPTAAQQGRLTLNPLKHVDPVGTVLIPATLYLFAGVFFGWAKPVPVVWRNLRNVRRDIAFVAGAGPGANLLMLIFWLVLYHLARGIGGIFATPSLLYMCWAGIMFNATIMLINLIPIPPLDGSRIVTSILPARAAYLYNRIEPFGLLLLAVLLFTNTLGALLYPSLKWIESLL